MSDAENALYYNSQWRLAITVNMEGRSMELKGSTTEENLMAAFAGESQARNRYTYFAAAARKEGWCR